VRYELVDLATMLVRETKHRGYVFGIAGDPSYGCWGYSCRAISGSSSPSNHSWGLALDINAPSNPYTSPLVTDMPDWMPDLWNAYGWRWGGDYSGDQDAMHYEYMGSVTDCAHDTNRARDNGVGGGSTTPGTPTDWWDEMSDAEKAQLLADVAWIKAQLGPLAGYGDDPGPYGYPQVIHTMANRVYECQQALRAIKGYGDDPAMYPYTQAFETLANRVYELTTRPA
jgi:hypothetical protein